MNKPRTSRIPAPLYAAAGVGDLAYESLRRLPTVVIGLGDRVATTRAELREKAVATLRVANRTAAGTAQALRGAATVREQEIDRLREAAIRNTAVVLTNAQTAQQKAVSVYGALVSRGERLIGSGAVQAAETVNADIAVTEVADVEATPTTVAEAVETTPAAKRPRPARTRKGAVAPADTPSAKLPRSSTTRTQAGAS